MNLKEIEKKAYRSTFEDGLFDIFYGCLMILFGVTPLLDHFNVPAPIKYLPIFLIILIIVIGKRKVTIPRMGIVKFGSKRKENRKKVIIISLVAVIITNSILILIISNIITSDELKQFGDYTTPVIIGIFITIVLSLKAYFLDFKRLYLYAILLGAGISIAEILYPYVGSPMDGIYAFCITGSGILIYGSYLLSVFLKNYPKPQ